MTIIKNTSPMDCGPDWGEICRENGESVPDATMFELVRHLTTIEQVALDGLERACVCACETGDYWVCVDEPLAPIVRQWLDGLQP